MSERQQLLALLALIYLGECLRWVRRGGIVFAGWPRPVAHRASPFLRNDRGDAYLAWPLPPFGEFLVVRGIPFSLSPRGILTFTTAGLHADGPPHQPARTYNWKDAASARSDGARVLIAGNLAWTADTPGEAARLAKLLRKGADIADDGRESWIADVARDQFDEKEARSRFEETATALRPIRHAAIALWSALFALIPAGVWMHGWSPTLWIGLPVVAALTGWIGTRSIRLHRAWYAEDLDDRFRTGLLTCLSPVTAIRATDLLARRRLESFHPAAAAAAVLPAAEAAELAGSLWRELGSPSLPPSGLPEEAERIEADWRQMQKDAFAGLGKRIGAGPATWDAPPRRSDPSHTRFCPRCHGQATAAATVCAACGGIALRDLPG